MKFSIPISPENYIEAHEWCEEHFGEEHFYDGEYTYCGAWRGLANNEVGGDFYFENEEDAVAFKLRWI